MGLVVEETQIPLRQEVRGACEILGLDPLYLANEGKCLAIVAPEIAEEAKPPRERFKHRGFVLDVGGGVLGCAGGTAVMLWLWKGTGVISAFVTCGPNWC